MITQNSRYADSTVVNLPKNGKMVQVIVPGAAIVYGITYVSHVWTDWDTPERLAEASYGDPAKWWVIGDANPEILCWIDVSPGTVVRVPVSATS